MNCDPKLPDKSKVGTNKSALSPVEECNTLWVELDHRTDYVDDYGQVEPAANTPFRITFGDGSWVVAELDRNGFARFDGIPDGDVEVEYEPDVDEEIADLKEQMQHVLDEIIVIEQEEYERIEKELQDARVFGLEFFGSNEIARQLKYGGAALKGVWNGVVGILEFAWDVVMGTGALVYELALRANPLTAPQKFQEDLEALKNAYSELERFVDEDLEAYAILMTDPDVYAMFGKFAREWVLAQHSLEMMEAGGEIALDIALAVVTSGAGGAASARHFNKLKKLRKLGDKLVDALKRKKRRKKRDIDRPNRRIATRVEPRRVPCFCPYRGRRFKRLSKEERKKYLQEYERQLRRQQDAINDMSVDEYLAARRAYGGQGRDPLADKAQEEYRDDFEEQIQGNIQESLLRKNKNMDPADAKKLAGERAKEVMAKLDALHEPDMVAGGWSKKDPSGMGESSVNRSIGPSWSGKGRLSTIDEQAREGAKAGKGDAKMNVKLEVCRGIKSCP